MAIDKKDNAEEEVAVPVIDPKAAWFEEKVLAALKIKSDKWKKMTTTVEFMYLLLT